MVFVCSKSSQVNQPLQDKILAIGAHITHNLAQECTHVLVDQLKPVKEDVLDATVSKKVVSGVVSIRIASKSNSFEPTSFTFKPELFLTFSTKRAFSLSIYVRNALINCTYKGIFLFCFYTGQRVYLWNKKETLDRKGLHSE